MFYIRIEIQNRNIKHHHHDLRISDLHNMYSNCFWSRNWDDRRLQNNCDNVFYRYFDQYHYFDHSQILIFIFSSRRRHRRRHQYEIIQKILYETSLNIAKIYSLIISVSNKRSFRIFCILSFSIHFYTHSNSLIRIFRHFDPKKMIQ